MEEITKLAREREPFLMVLSYDLTQQFVQPLKNLDNDVFFKIGNQRNYPQKPLKKKYHLHKSPIAFNTYKVALKKYSKRFAQAIPICSISPLKLLLKATLRLKRFLPTPERNINSILKINLSVFHLKNL